MYLRSSRSSLERTTALFSTAAAAWLWLLPARSEAQITPVNRYPSNEAQYTLELINRARATGNGLTILQGLVTNNLNAITASTTGTSSNGTPWSSGFWTSSIPGVADSMNYFHVHPGDLKKQFVDLAAPDAPLAWQARLGTVAEGYNKLVIANQGAGPGFPHALAPYDDQSTLEAYAERYLDAGYGPLSELSALGENIAPNAFASALATFAGFMIDWGNTPNGIQPQDPEVGSHRLSIMSSGFADIGISRRSGWSTGSVTETQEFGHRWTTPPAIVGSVFVDRDGNGFFSSGEGVGGVNVTATPVGGGAIRQVRTFDSGGYVLPIDTPGNYTLTVAGVSGTVATLTVGSENVRQNVIAAVGQPPADLNGDAKPDYVLQQPSTQRTAIWHLNGVTKTGEVAGPTLSAGWTIAAVADMDGYGHPDYLFYNASTRKTAVWYLQGAVQTGWANGPTLDSGWSFAGLADFNRDGHLDYLLYQSSTRKTAVWYLKGMTKIGTGTGPTIAANTSVAGLADFNADGRPDLLLYNASNRSTTIWYLENATKTGEASGPSLSSGWSVAGLADFNADNRPDFALYNTSDRRTEIWYLNGVVKLSAASGPTLPAGWNLVSP